MPAYVVDIECDGLYDEVTKIHCLSYTLLGELNVKSLVTYDEIRHFLSQPDLLCLGHNFAVFDCSVLEKILDSKFDYRIIDTLAVSYYLHSSDGRQKHGLEQFGVELGVAKPPVVDWKNEPIEIYVHRCEEDVKINYKVYKEQQSYLRELYDGDNTKIIELLEYLTFKFDCLKEHNENRIPLNIDLLVNEMLKLEKLVDEKRTALLSVMPEVIKYRTLAKPKKMDKADGSLSVAGEKWEELIKEQGLPKNVEEIKVIASREIANPDSTSQIKDWLYNLGWIPKHIKYDRNKVTNEVRQIPQITNENDKTEVCDSILDLAEEVPEVQYLAGYSTVKHRLTILKGFIRDMDYNCKMNAEALGFTNTLRFRHRGLVNLPKPTAPFAENIRACLIAGDNHYMVGADLKGIEDNSKLHYIYPFDPEYVKTMQTDDWDAHLDIAIRAGLLTEEQVADHKSGKVNYKEERSKAKTVNFASTYKTGAKTLARNLKTTEKKAKKILDAYWERNKAILEFEKTCETKTVRGQLWVKQPISGFWYTLRSLRDVFSTVNQSSAVFIFDTWVKYVRKQGIKLCGQWHDEHLSIHHNDVPRNTVETKIKEAMRLTNEQLKLNIEISCSLDFGTSYLECH